MRKPCLILKSLILCALVLACASFAHGQQRTFVSGTGSDANPCTRTAPCRGFQRGHDVVATGGEVVALDSAGYAALTITKSVTISGEGIRAALTATGGANGITINAPSATVILRELTITGIGASADGVFVQDAATVYIERCVITSFGSDGIDYRTTNRLFVTDTVSRSNGQKGLRVNAPAGGTARINVDRSRFERNGTNGIELSSQGATEASITNSIMSENGFGLVISSAGNTRAQVAHSTAANNQFTGFIVSGGGANELNIEYSVARGNGSSGMFVGSGDTIRVSNSVSTNNEFGFSNNGSTFESRSALNNLKAPGTNTVRGNGTDVSGAITYFNGN